MNKLIFTLFSFFICAQTVLGQVQRVKDFKMPPGISEIEVDKIIVGIDKKLTEYRRAGTLLNPKTHVIDRESINAFKALFELDAKVYNDMQEYSDDILYEVEGYTNIARNYFSQDGISFGISDPILKTVAVYEDEYVCSVFLTKSTEKYYTSNADVKQESRTFNLEFVFAIRKNNLGVAKIRTIRSGTQTKIATSYTSYLGVDLRAGIQQVGNTTSTDFARFGAKGELSATAKPDYQGGFVWYSNFLGAKKSPKKNLFVTAGVNLQYSSLEATLKNYALPAYVVATAHLSDQSVYDSLVFQALNVNVTENVSIARLQASLGVSYRLMNKSTTALMLDLTYVPSFSIYANSSIGNDSKGDYDLHDFKNAYYNFLKELENPVPTSPSILAFKQKYSRGEQTIEYSWKPKTNLVHQVGLSLTFFKDFIDDSPTFGIAVGLDAIIGVSPLFDDITLGKGPLFKQINSRRDQNYQGDDTTGLFGSYLQDVTLRNFGLRIVIYRKASRKP
jgi:hypothetical protein